MEDTLGLIKCLDYQGVFIFQVCLCTKGLVWGLKAGDYASVIILLTGSTVIVDNYIGCLYDCVSYQSDQINYTCF